MTAPVWFRRSRRQRRAPYRSSGRGRTAVGAACGSRRESRACIRDFFPVVVMNAILGGLFSFAHQSEPSRRARVHVRRASSFDWRRRAGPFSSRRPSQRCHRCRGAEILREIDRMHRPITDEELTLATSYLGGVFPIRFESTNAIATALANLVSYGLTTATSTATAQHSCGDCRRRAASGARVPAPRPAADRHRRRPGCG